MSEYFEIFAQLAHSSWQKKLAFGVCVLLAIGMAFVALKEASGYTFRDLVSAEAPKTVSPAARTQLQARLRKAASDGAVSADEMQELRAFTATLNEESAAAETYLAELQPGLLKAIREVRDGSELAAKGDFAEARLRFREATLLDGDNASAWANFGGVALELGDLAEAEAALRKALTLAPDSPTAHYNLGACLAAQGEQEAALVHLEQAVALLLRDATAAFDNRALRADLNQSRFFAALRSSPRFAALLRRIP